MDLDYYMQGNEREYRKLVAQYQNETEGGWCSLRMTCTHVYSVAYLILNSVYCNPHGSIPRLLKNSKPFEDGQLSLCNGLYIILSLSIYHSISHSRNSTMSKILFSKAPSQQSLGA